MKTIATILCVGAVALFTTTASVQAVPVNISVDASLEGLATNLHTPLQGGVIEIGWLNAGTTQTDIVNFFAAGNLGAIDGVFNTVLSVNFSLGSANTFGTGLVYESVDVVADGDTTGLAAYKSPTTGASGKLMYAWVRDSALLGSTNLMAFVDTTSLFPTANDTIGFTDWSATAALDDEFSISPSNVWVGSINPVVVGGAIDTNGGDPANGLTPNGGSSVLQLAVVPEPSTAALTLIGLAGLVARRRRA